MIFSLVRARIFSYTCSVMAVATTCFANADESRPPEHFCPINMTVMRSPVVASDGQSYEEAAIQEWFKQNRNGAIKSPVSGDIIDCSIVPNMALKKIIEEWKPGREAIPSKLASEKATEIARKVKEEFDQNKQLLEPAQTAKDKHIVAFLGNTGAGKSTLVNLLAGKALQVSPDKRRYVLVHNGDSSAMPIGTGGDSETRYPKSIDVDIPGLGTLRLFDLPGFNDTDGSERNLVNAAFTRRILLEAASVRLIFVVGEDQFTADKAASVRDMFQTLKNLFVVNGKDSERLVHDGVFVGTKILGDVSDDIVSFLLQTTRAQDKEELNLQLSAWQKARRIQLVPHALMAADLNVIRANILGAIASASAVKINGINVSALYPPQTANDLFRMFNSVMDSEFSKKEREVYQTLSEYDDAISDWSHSHFWDRFDDEICGREKAVHLLKDFSFTPYEKAKRALINEKTAHIQRRINDLNNSRAQRINDIKERTASKALATVLSIGQPEDDERIMFDFAYHKDFYEHVCGPNYITQIATDPKEQEVVRRHYAGWIADHSHQQMMKWHQRYSGYGAVVSGYGDVVKRLAILEGKLFPPASGVSVDRPISDGLVIPDIARGHEDVYRMFLNGVLFYKKGQPDEIKMPIAALANPLGGVFDLSRCGDTGNYLSIRTGYRKEKITYPNASPGNGTNRAEIWFAPRFLIERELSTTAGHFQNIMGSWDDRTVPIGIFWSWSNDDLGAMWYLTTPEACDNSKNLYETAKLTPRHTYTHINNPGFHIYTKVACARDLTFHVH